MPPVFRADPYLSSNFEVVIQGVSDDGKAVKGSFSEVHGLDVELDVVEYRNGSEDITVRKLPGLKKFTNVVLKRGVIGDLTFWNWILSAMKGSVRRANMSITLLDEARNPVMQWHFVRAWPCKWAGPMLNAKSNEVAIETLEICHEGMSIDGQA